ncbi:hypothetical protein [Halorubrum sp. F4]|uniref:hypothetical protein n=1 Tax=Halorubrum sp. F4 TaxID=2989715 RepID=UPI002481266E|nr:hypothetical protein [Halorubrum sp. F4]
MTDADGEIGDECRWRVTEDGTLSIELVTQRYGAFSRLEPVDTGEPIDAATDHDLFVGDP